jgi:hypothetical protein
MSKAAFCVGLDLRLGRPWSFVSRGSWILMFLDDGQQLFLEMEEQVVTMARWLDVEACLETPSQRFGVLFWPRHSSKSTTSSSSGRHAVISVYFHNALSAEATCGDRRGLGLGFSDDLRLPKAILIRLSKPVLPRRLRLVDAIVSVLSADDRSFCCLEARWKVSGGCGRLWARMSPPLEDPTLGVLRACEPSTLRLEHGHPTHSIEFFLLFSRPLQRIKHGGLSSRLHWVKRALSDALCRW